MREAWRTTGDDGRCDDMPPRELQPHEIWYEADGLAPHDLCVGKYRPSMFMPRWASRITLEVTGVRVERLQEISEADAISEGAAYHEAPNNLCHNGWSHDDWHLHPNAKDSFTRLWNSLNAARGYGWNANPWVWIVEFRRIK